MATKRRTFSTAPQPRTSEKGKMRWMLTSFPYTCPCGFDFSDLSELTSFSTRDPRDIPLPLTPVAVSGVRHVRTLDSAGKTPILVRDAPSRTREQPDVSSRVASYLDTYDPSVHPDHTPFTEDLSADETDVSSGMSSRKTSASTVKAPTTNAGHTGVVAQQEHVHELPRASGHLIHVDSIEARRMIPIRPIDETGALGISKIDCSSDDDVAGRRSGAASEKGRTHFPHPCTPLKHIMHKPFWHCHYFT